MAKNIKRFLYRNLFIDTNPDYKNTIFLAGTGRSGTTWLSELINYNKQYRPIFEPFYPQKVGLCKDFQYKQYLRPDSENKKVYKATEKILTGKFRNSWTDRYVDKFIFKKRLIKEIRANLFLKWLKINFPDLRLIYILRHPCAVVNSRMKLTKWSSHLDIFLSNDELMEDYLYPVKEKIENTHDVFEKNIYLWCIENFIPLNQLDKKEYCLLFYENLCIEPELEIRRLFNYIGQAYDDKILLKINKPSKQTRKESAIISGDSLIASWKKNISQKQIEKAIEILTYFELDNYYDSDPMPKFQI